MRTQRGKVQEAWKGDSPEVCRVDNVATVDLGGEQGSDARASGRNIRQRTNQKTIRQPIVQAEHNIGDKAESPVANVVLVIKWPGAVNCGCQLVVFTVIDKGIRLNVEVHHGVHGHKREHGHGVEYEPPLDALPSAMGGVEERCHTLEKKHDEHP